MTNANEIQSKSGGFAAWVFADGVRSLAQLFRVSHAEALGMLTEEVGEPVERVREWARGVFSDGRDRVRFGDAVEALERGPISDLKAKLRAEYDRAQQEKEKQMDKQAVLDKARQAGEKLKAKPHDEANARARNGAAENAARLAADRAEAPLVFFDDDGAWLNEPFLTRLFSSDVRLAILSDAIPGRTFEEKQRLGDLTIQWECRFAPAIEALLRTGGLGEARRNRIRIVTAGSAGDLLAEQAARQGVVVGSDTLVHPFTRKVIKGELERRHESAVSELSQYNDRSEPTLRDKARGTVYTHRAPHLVRWVCKNPANPWEGLTRNAEECLPLEVGVNLDVSVVLWIRRLPKEA